MEVYKTCDLFLLSEYGHTPLMNEWNQLGSCFVTVSGVGVILSSFSLGLESNKYLGC